MRQHRGWQAKRVCPNELITSGAGICSNNGWSDSIADERHVREPGEQAASWQRPRKGGRAVRRAVMRVWLERDSKAAMWMPTRRLFGEGRTNQEKPGAAAR